MLNAVQVIDAADYRIGLNVCLGLPREDSTGTCAGCKSVIDVYGEHEMCCI